MLRRRPVMRTVARTAVIAGTATAVSGRVARRQQNKYAAQEQVSAEQQAAAAPQPPPPAAGESTDDQLVQLQKLGELHQQGILTDEEFAAKKAQILGI
jgi:Short C-terminal domain